MKEKNHAAGSWLARYGALARRLETEPETMTAEDLAEMERIEMLAALMGPDELAGQAAQAVWQCLSSKLPVAGDEPQTPRVVKAAAHGQFLGALLKQICGRGTQRAARNVLINEVVELPPEVVHADDRLLVLGENVATFRGLEGVEVVIGWEGGDIRLDPGEEKSVALRALETRRLTVRLDPDGRRVIRVEVREE